MSTPPTTAPPTPTSWLPLVTCCLANFLLLTYTTVATVGVARISAELGGGYASSQWIIDVYTLALAASVLAMGTVGDHLGHARLLLGGLAVFVAATIACSVSQSAAQLVAARSCQGLAGAAALATTVPLLVRHYSGRQRATAFAVWGAVAGAGSSLGLVGGGAVADHVSWRWLFVAGVPLGLTALATGARSLAREPRRPVRIDVPGTLTVTVAMAALTYAAIEAGGHGWTSPGAVAGLLLALLAAVALAPVERRARRPVLPPGLFATRRFVGVLVVAGTYYFGAFAALPAVSAWLQDTVGMSALQASLVVALQLAAFVAVSLLLSARLHLAPTTQVLGGGTVLTGIAALTGGALWATPDWPLVLIVLVGTGIGAGIVSPVLPAVAATAVPDEHTGTAAAAANSARQLGLTVGVALCGALAHRPGTGPTAAAHGIGSALVLSGAVATAGGVLAIALLRHPRRPRPRVGTMGRCSTTSSWPRPISPRPSRTSPTGPASRRRRAAATPDSAPPMP